MRGRGEPLPVETLTRDELEKIQNKHFRSQSQFDAPCKSL
jgi:hypothetical protein